MSLEERIRKISEAIPACKDEAQLVSLTQELQNAIHEYVEGLREKVLKIPAVIEKNIEAA